MDIKVIDQTVVIEDSFIYVHFTAKISFNGINNNTPPTDLQNRMIGFRVTTICRTRWWRTMQKCQAKQIYCDHPSGRNIQSVRLILMIMASSHSVLISIEPLLPNNYFTHSLSITYVHIFQRKFHCIH